MENTQHALAAKAVIDVRAVSGDLLDRIWWRSVVGRILDLSGPGTEPAVSRAENAQRTWISAT